LNKITLKETPHQNITKTDKDIRRTGGRAEDNGNLMKIASVNKYSNNKNKFTKRENFVNI